MTTTSRSARMARWLSIPLGLAISALLIWQASYAAFSDTTTSAGNTWRTGTVELTNTHEAVPLFQETNLAPGATDASERIKVSYTGSLPANVKFYAKNVEDSASGLADFITVTVNVVDSNYAHRGQIYTGTLADLAKAGEATATAPTAPANPGDWATLEFVYALSTAAPSTVQGEEVKLDLVAEATNR